MDHVLSVDQEVDKAPARVNEEAVHLEQPRHHGLGVLLHEVLRMRGRGLREAPDDQLQLIVGIGRIKPVTAGSPAGQATNASQPGLSELAHDKLLELIEKNALHWPDRTQGREAPSPANAGVRRYLMLTIIDVKKSIKVPEKGFPRALSYCGRPASAEAERSRAGSAARPLRKTSSGRTAASKSLPSSSRSAPA